MTNSQSRQQGGYTFVELVVVIGVMGIMAMMAMPSLNQVMAQQAPGYRDQVAATIEYARKMAVAMRRHVCVRIDAASVTVTTDNGLPVNHANGTCSNPLTLPSGSNVLTAPSNVTASPATSLDFDAQGRPVTTASAVTITVTDASASLTATLTIEAESGYVH